MSYPPPEEEAKLLQPRHAELSRKLIKLVIEIADRIRQSPELSAGLSVRATDEGHTYLKHPLIASQRSVLLPEVLKSSFCGRFAGRWNDVSSDAGAAWAIIESVLREKKLADD
jgi:hypothetical protein